MRQASEWFWMGAYVTWGVIFAAAHLLFLCFIPPFWRSFKGLVYEVKILMTHRGHK